MHKYVVTVSAMDSDWFNRIGIILLYTYSTKPYNNLTSMWKFMA